MEDEVIHLEFNNTRREEGELIVKRRIFHVQHESARYSKGMVF
jgi:hypothetical protein